ncbi:MAG: cytochrome b561 domain-containing protein [Paracoccaceae bacterium]
MIDWLMAPIDSTRPHDVGGLMSWHARSMVGAWAVLVPVGVLSARYLKVTPWQDWPNELDDRTWWNLHRGAQYAAGALMLLGLALVLAHPGPVASLTPQAWLHRSLGWVLLGLAASQYLSAWLRGSKGGPTAPALDGSLRGDHFDMTPRRLIFEWVHKLGGTLAVLLAVAAILSGLWQLNAPRWMWVVLAGWWGVLVVSVILAERHLGAHDTYQAIWGPDPNLPGNRRKPIDWRTLRGQKR